MYSILSSFWKLQQLNLISSRLLCHCWTNLKTLTFAQYHYLSIHYVDVISTVRNGNIERSPIISYYKFCGTSSRYGLRILVFQKKFNKQNFRFALFNQNRNSLSVETAEGNGFDEVNLIKNYVPQPFFANFLNIQSESNF